MRYLPVLAMPAMLGIEIALGRLSALRARHREWQSMHAHDRFVRDLRPTPVRPYRPGGAR